MTENKRFTWEYSHNDSTGEIIDWIRNECLMTDYLQKYELEEWCQELNKIVDENNQLRKENEQLKKKILEEIDLEVAYVNETYSDGRMSKEQHNGAIISLRQLREKFE